MENQLQSLPFWGKLLPDEQKMCAESASIKSYNANTYLLGAGANSCLGMLHIITGEIRAFIISDEGREITLFKLCAGENCVLSASCVLSQITFETQLCVTKDAEVLLIPSSVFGKLMQNNIYARCFALELITERFSSAMWVMQQILFLGFDKRLAGFLISEYEKTGKAEIKMTQEEIAVATNSAREVVARMLKQFAVDGLIESKRGIILIKNPQQLKKII